MHAAPSTKATSPLGCLMTAMMLALAGFAPLTTHSEEATKEADPEAFSGDVGLGVLHGAGGIQGVRARTSLEPYLNFEKGRLFARIDSFGVKTLPLGMGHLELLGQVRSDGYKGGGWAQRKDPVPLGLGTLQITPIGAFGLNAYVGGLIELPVSGPWVLNLYLRRVFVDRTLANSPLAGHGHRDTALLALTYRY